MMIVIPNVRAAPVSGKRRSHAAALPPAVPILSARIGHSIVHHLSNYLARQYFSRHLHSFLEGFIKE